MLRILSAKDKLDKALESGLNVSSLVIVGLDSYDVKNLPVRKSGRVMDYSKGLLNPENVTEDVLRSYFADAAKHSDIYISSGDAFKKMPSGIDLNKYYGHVYFLNKNRVLNFTLVGAIESIQENDVTFYDDREDNYSEKSLADTAVSGLVKVIEKRFFIDYKNYDGKSKFDHPCALKLSPWYVAFLKSVEDPLAKPDNKLVINELGAGNPESGDGRRFYDRGI